MMAYFGILLLIAIVVVIGYFIFAYMAGSKVENPVINSTSVKATKLNGKAVRQLDLLLADPTLIASENWNETSRKIINEWYNGK